VLRELPAKSAILDGEIVASDAAGMPDFRRLFLRSAKLAELHVRAFDLLALNRKDLRKWSLEAGQGRLQALMSRFDCPTVLASEPFKEGNRAAWARRPGEQAALGALPLGRMPRLVQGQDGHLARGEPGEMAPLRAGLSAGPGLTRRLNVRS
jgi:hypothetical protein